MKSAYLATDLQSFIETDPSMVSDLGALIHEHRMEIKLGSYMERKAELNWLDLAKIGGKRLARRDGRSDTPGDGLLRLVAGRLREHYDGRMLNDKKKSSLY